MLKIAQSGGWWCGSFKSAQNQAGKGGNDERVGRAQVTIVWFNCSISGTGRSDYIAGMSALEMVEEVMVEEKRRESRDQR